MKSITVTIVGTGWIGKETTNPSRTKREIKYARVCLANDTQRRNEQ